MAPHVPTVFHGLSVTSWETTSPSGVQVGRCPLAIAMMGVKELGGEASRHGDEGNNVKLGISREGVEADSHSSIHQHTPKAPDTQVH